MGERTRSFTFSSTDVVFYAIILLGFVVMGITVMNSKNLNQALSDEIKQTTEDFQAFREKSEMCFKELEAKDTEINTK